MRKLYIAHPLQGGSGNMEENVEHYLTWVAFAMELGYCVVTWVHHYLTHTRKLTDGDAEYYLTIDKELVLCCDEVWVVGDPAISNGVRFEISVAEEAGIPVRYFKWNVYTL